MTRRIYAAEEQAQLRANPNVLSCSDKTVVYSDDFKRFILHGYFEEGRSPRSMFAECGFPDFIVSSLVPKWTLQRWRRTYGSAYADRDLSNKTGRSKKGGRPRKGGDIATMTDHDRAMYFEARAAYLDKENDFLAGARGEKRWPTFVWAPGKDTHS